MGNIELRVRVALTVTSPNPVRVAWSILMARRVTPPRTFGTGGADHTGFIPVLEALAGGGTSALTDVQDDLDRYLSGISAVEPTDLNRSEQLAFWLNLYNAGALKLATRALVEGASSVLRVPGGFGAPVFDVAGERLSLDSVEHGKIRRFGDPRIHAALVCGSVSCPTLRYEPYRGQDLETQLDHQMRSFLSKGGALLDGETATMQLSRVFLWYGGDFVRPHRMPTWIPARRQSLLTALTPWLDEGASMADSGRTKVVFQSYDWGLRCSVA